MTQSFRQKLTSNAYQQYFQRTDFTPFSDLAPLWDEIATDLEITPQEVINRITFLIPTNEASYLQVKKALARQFILSRKVTPEPEVHTPVSTENPIQEQWETASVMGKMPLPQAVSFFSGVNPTLELNEIEKFKSVLAEKLSPRSGGKVNWKGYAEAVQEWEGQKEQSDPVTSKLESTIADYKAALQNLEDKSPQKAAIKDLISTLERQLQDLKSPCDPAVLLKLQRRQFKSLQMIFSFYCKQQLNSGKTTFENISESNSNWNLGKFVKFALDFGLTGKQTNRDRLLSKEELKSIFISCSDSRKLLDFAHFLTALSQIADKKYDFQYDKIHNTNAESKSLVDKQALLYIDMHLEDTQVLKQTMKPFSVPFSHEKDGFRVPEDDPASRYQPISEERKEALRQWKKRKEIFSKNSESISSLQSSAEDVQLSMAKIPSDAVALKRAPPGSYSEIYHLRHHPVSLTWQTLSNLEYEEINAGDDLEELVGMDKTEGDTLLDRQYHLGKWYSRSAWKTGLVGGVPKKSAAERKYDGLMKIVEEKGNKASTAYRRLSTMSFINQSSIRSLI